MVEEHPCACLDRRRRGRGRPGLGRPPGCEQDQGEHRDEHAGGQGHAREGGDGDGGSCDHEHSVCSLLGSTRDTTEVSPMSARPTQRKACLSEGKGGPADAPLPPPGNIRTLSQPTPPPPASGARVCKAPPGRTPDGPDASGGRPGAARHPVSTRSAGPGSRAPPTLPATGAESTPPPEAPGERGAGSRHAVSRTEPAAPGSRPGPESPRGGPSHVRS